MTKYESELEEARRNMYAQAEEYSALEKVEAEQKEALWRTQVKLRSLKSTYVQWRDEANRLAADPLNLGAQ